MHLINLHIYRRLSFAELYQNEHWRSLRSLKIWYLSPVWADLSRLPGKSKAQCLKAWQMPNFRWLFKGPSLIISHCLQDYIYPGTEPLVPSEVHQLTGDYFCPRRQSNSHSSTEPLVTTETGLLSPDAWLVFSAAVFDRSNLNEKSLSQLSMRRVFRVTVSATGHSLCFNLTTYNDSGMYLNKYRQAQNTTL